MDNSGYLASLELHKIYRVIPDEDAAQDGDIRVVDESGEDYLYSADRFIATIANVDVLVSWNFRHIVRLDKIRLFNSVTNPDAHRGAHRLQQSA